MVSSTSVSRGSEWRRWDPHLHAPGTLLNDQFGGDWEAYLRAAETAQPAVEALGVTDYFCIRTYREVLQQKQAGRLRGVSLVFPNVEMRLDIKTDRAKPINLHLLFSPDDPRHEAKIEDALEQLVCEFRGNTYRCCGEHLTEIGKLVQTDQRDDLAALRAGAQQFKVDLPQLRKFFRSNRWVRDNCLVAVAGGRNDGTSGLQADDSYRLMREEIERFADIIFASTPSQREFWLGRRSLSVDAIERTYRSLKPCMHGSDAHAEGEVLAPDQQRFTWLKGDATFETLRQAVLEPEERVWIGASPPHRGSSVRTIDRVAVSGAPWLASPPIDLNPGLVAIIGERGSGKTALVEIIARGARASWGPDESTASFLHRATHPDDLIGDASVDLSWSDGGTTSAELRPEKADVDPWDFEVDGVMYLSQQFVERLCSATGLAIQLRQEIERVIFEATPRDRRNDATSFEELADTSLQPIRQRRDELREAIALAGDRMEEEDALKTKLPVARKERDTLVGRLTACRSELAKLLPTRKDERAKRLLQLEVACTTAETALQGQRRRLQRLKDLAIQVEHIRTTTEPMRFRQMKQIYANAGLGDNEWAAFLMDFTGDVAGVVARAQSVVESAISIATNGDPFDSVDITTAPFDRWPLTALVAERDKVKQEVGIDARKQARYDELGVTIGKLESAVRKLDEAIAHAEGADARRNEARHDRQQAYAQVFATLKEEEATLQALYGPLAAQIGARHGAVAKLAFIVERDIDLDDWVARGQALLDLRVATQFRHGRLAALAEEHLLKPWKTGDADAVAAAMTVFVDQIWEDIKRAKLPSVEDRSAWLRDVARWIYSTEHVSMQYAITYDGVRVEQLSPGTRGIVLLLLYLVLDQHDERPLIIDQPEENLDPKSVFDELVPHFRAARARRQVIVVTHNANLVVNTDADQILVATAKHETPGQLPTIRYTVGTLENPETRAAVCATLEGGKRALLERAKRYRLRWDGTADS